jgi:hypothetical protein
MFFWNGRLGPPLSPNCVNGYTVYAVELYRTLVLTVMTFRSLLALCSPGTTQDATICLISLGNYHDTICYDMCLNCTYHF